MELYIGTSGWLYKHWFERFYPEDLPRKDWFQYYTQHFSTVEINSTFYHWPKEKTIINWYENSPKDFIYTLKAPRTITHTRRLKDIEQPVEDFYQLGDLLKEKMGCYLFQMHPRFILNEINLERLNIFLKCLDQRKENVVEFRHHTWWNEEIINLLSEYNASFCIVSGLKMPEDVIVNRDFVYYRFHGERYDTLYSKDEIKKYAESIKRMNIKKLYAYFNNDTNAYAIRNTKELIKELKS